MNPAWWGARWAGKVRKPLPGRAERGRGAEGTERAQIVGTIRASGLLDKGYIERNEPAHPQLSDSIP